MPDGSWKAEIIAVPALTPVIALSTIETIVGSLETKLHLPVEFDVGTTGLTSFSPTPTMRGKNAPIAGGVPMTVTSKVTVEDR